MAIVPQISPKEAKKLLDDGKIIIIDVREPHEIEFSNIPGTIPIPLSQFNAKIDEVLAYRDHTVAILCRSGARSARVTHFLKNQGFSQVYNIKGGILQWSDEVDPSVKKYYSQGTRLIEIQ